MTICSVKLNEPDVEDSSPTTEEPKVLILDTEKAKLPPERIKVRIFFQWNFLRIKHRAVAVWHFNVGTRNFLCQLAPHL